MATQDEKWRIVKTSGGYGVLKSSRGATVTKTTIVKPSSTNATSRTASNNR